MDAMSKLYSEPLVFACFRMNPVTLFTRIQQGCDVNHQDDQKRTPLHAAAYIGSAECCQTLLDSGAEINVKDSLWVTPLHWACLNGDEDTVQVLLEHHADAGVRDKNYQTPIHVAAGNGHTLLCQKLHSAGATVSLPDRQGRTAMHLAAYNGHVEVISFLMSKKADVEKKDRGGRTPLHWAAFRGHTGVVELLTGPDGKVSDVNVKDKSGCTALHAAAAAGSLACVESLIKNGADTTAKDLKGRTPLHYAASGGFEVAIEALAAAVNDINMVDNRGQTALHKAAHHGVVDALEVLMIKGAEPEIRDQKGRTALHVACAKGDLDCVDLLVQEGKDSKTMVDNNGNTIVHYAVRGGHIHLVHLFQTYSFDLATKGQSGMTPLHMAALFGHITCVRKLADDSSKLESKPDINATDESGRRPIHAAAFAGTFDAVEYLISKGADCNVADTFKRTPLHYAAAMSNEHVCKLINTSMEDHVKSQVDVLGRTALHYAASADFDCVRFFMREGSVATQGDKSYVTPLHMAAWYGNKRSIEFILELVDASDTAVNAKDKSDRVPLHFAACAGHVDAVDVLLQIQGVDVNAVDTDGRTALDAAAFKGHPECIELLIEKGANVNTTDKLGRTPLMAAATMGMDEAVEILLGDEDENISDVGKVDVLGRNALMLAAASGCIAAAPGSEESVRMIIDNGGIDVNAADNFGMTALHHALSALNLSDTAPSKIDLGMAGVDAVEEAGVVKDILEALVSNDADVGIKDHSGITLGHLAAINNCEDILRIIAEKFPVNTTDHYGHTPLHYACYHGHASCVAVLIDEDVEFENDNESSFGILHCTAIGGSAECLEVLLEELEDDDALDLNVVDENGLTPLHWAAKCGHLAVVDTLCGVDGDAAVNLEAKDRYGNTALALAVVHQHHEVCASLIRQGADFDVALHDGTSLLHTIYAEQAPATGAAVLEAVLGQLETQEKSTEEIEAHLIADDSMGRTILHLAAGKHDTASIKLILANVHSKENPIMDKKDSSGNTPLHYLIPSSNGRDCLDIILDHMSK